MWPSLCKVSKKMAAVRLPWLSTIILIITCTINLAKCQGDIKLSCVSPSSFTDSNTDLRCGEVVSSKTGVIYHKAYSQLEANERCVWTLALPVSWSKNYVEIELHVLHIGYPGGDSDVTNAQLILTGIAPNDTTLENRISIKATGKHRLPYNTRLATLTFTTGDFDATSYNYTGFIAQYTAVNGDTIVSAGNMINNTVPLKLSHTNNYGYTQRTQVTTFVIPPSRNFYPNQGSYPLIYLDRRKHPAACATATFTVYNFNSASAKNPWDLADKFDLGKDTRIIQRHDDIQMIVLRADTFTELTLFHMKCND